MRSFSKKDRAKRDMADRAKAYWRAKPAVERVRRHFERIDSPTSTRAERLMLWRLIASAAMDAYEIELKELGSLNFPVSDPAVASLVGGPSE